MTLFTAACTSAFRRSQTLVPRGRRKFFNDRWGCSALIIVSGPDGSYRRGLPRDIVGGRRSGDRELSERMGSWVSNEKRRPPDGRRKFTGRVLNGRDKLQLERSPPLAF